MEGLVDYARRQIKCPECRAEHRIPYNGVQSFPNNVTLARFLDLHRGITGEEPEPLPSQMDRCGVCGEKSVCLRCAHCEKKVCEECRSAHLDILRREINRINTQVRRSLVKLAEQAGQTGKSSERLAMVASQIRDEITEAVRRFVKDLKDKEAKLLADLDEFTESESKNSEKLNDDLDLELATITSNCELVEEHVTETDEWTDAELMEYRDIFTKTLDFLRNLDPDTTDLSRKIKFIQKVDLDAMRRNAADFGEIKITSPNTASLLAGGLLSPSDSSSNLVVPGSNLMRSQSDHRLAAQFAKGKDSALQRSYLDVTGGTGASGRYGSDSDRDTRGGSPPGRREGRFGSVRSYGARGADALSAYSRGWERPGDATTTSDPYEPSSGSNFRSRFMRDRMRGGADEHSFEADSHDGSEGLTSASHRVRFQEEAGAGATGGRCKLFDTEEMASLRAPLSGIIKLVDLPFVMERVHQNGVKAKQKEQEAKENGSSGPNMNNTSNSNTPIHMPTPTPPRPTRQISEDEIEKQKKANKAEAAANAANASSAAATAATPAPATPKSSPPAPKTTGSLAVESSTASSRTSPSSAPSAAVSNRRVQALQKEDTSRGGGSSGVRSSASSDDGSVGDADSVGDVTADDDSITATASAAAASSATRRRIYASGGAGGSTTSAAASSNGGAGAASSSVDYGSAETTATGRGKQGSAASSASNRQVPTSSSTSSTSTVTSASNNKYSSPSSTNNTSSSASSTNATSSSSSSSKSSNRRAKAKDTNNNYTDPLYDTSSHLSSSSSSHYSSQPSPSSTATPSSRSLFSPTRSTVGSGSANSAYSSPSSYHPSSTSSNNHNDYSSTNRSTALYPLTSSSPSASSYSSPYSSSSSSSKSKYSSAGSGGGSGGSGSAISDYLLGSDLLDHTSSYGGSAYDPHSYSSSTRHNASLLDSSATKSSPSSNSALLSSYSSSSPSARHLASSSTSSSSTSGYNSNSAVPGSSGTGGAAHSSSLSNLPFSNSNSLSNWRDHAPSATSTPAAVITSSAVALDPSSGASFMPPGANLAIAPAIGSTAASQNNQSTEPLLLPNAHSLITTHDDTFVALRCLAKRKAADESGRRRRPRPPAHSVQQESQNKSSTNSSNRQNDSTKSARGGAEDEEASSSRDSSRKYSDRKVVEQSTSGLEESSSSLAAAASLPSKGSEGRRKIRIKAKVQSPQANVSLNSGSLFAGAAATTSSSPSVATSTSSYSSSSYRPSNYTPSHSYRSYPSSTVSSSSSSSRDHSSYLGSSLASTSTTPTSPTTTTTSTSVSSSNSSSSALNRSNAYLSSSRSAAAAAVTSQIPSLSSSSSSGSSGNYRHNLSSMALPNSSSSSSSNVTHLMRAIVTCSRFSPPSQAAAAAATKSTGGRKSQNRVQAKMSSCAGAILEMTDSATVSLLWFLCEATLMVTLVSLTLITVTVPDSLSLYLNRRSPPFQQFFFFSSAATSHSPSDVVVLDGAEHEHEQATESSGDSIKLTGGL